MIAREDEYRQFITDKGVGRKDRVPGKSVQSYVAYLNSAAKMLNCDITAQLFPNRSQADFESVCRRIKDDQQYAEGTHRNAVSALRHYFNMVAENR